MKIVHIKCLICSAESQASERTAGILKHCAIFLKLVDAVADPERGSLGQLPTLTSVTTP